MLTLQEWHRRFTRQSLWTASIRQYLYRRTALAQNQRVLDVGCGSGVITADLLKNTGALITGIDIRLDFLQFASANLTPAGWLQADGLTMPFAPRVFDSAYCHYVLLWISDPLRLIVEMKRVVRPGGFVIALAEPDYGGRIDYPQQFESLGILQTQSLQRQGADPLIGRKLNGLFHQAGLEEIEIGLLGGQWLNPPSPEEWESEWEMLASDLLGLISPDDLAELKQDEYQAWEKGERILYVPTFFAVGRVPR